MSTAAEAITAVRVVLITLSVIIILFISGLVLLYFARRSERKCSATVVAATSHLASFTSNGELRVRCPKRCSSCCLTIFRNPLPTSLVFGGCGRLLHALNPPRSAFLFQQFLARCHPYILLHFDTCIM